MLGLSVVTLFKTHKRIITEYQSGGSIVTDFLQMIGTGKRSFISKKLEILLILRNRQPRKVILLALLYMAGMLYFIYTTVLGKGMHNPTVPMVFAYGLPQLIYGKYFIAWYGNSIHFIMSRPVKWKDLIGRHSQILILLNLLTWVGLLPAAWVNLQNLWNSTGVLFYSIGINQFILLIWGLNVRKSLTPNNSGLMGSSEIKASEVLLILTLLVTPVAVHLALKTLFSDTLAIAGLWVLGLGAILFRNYLHEQLAKAFDRKKYILITNLNIE